MKKILFALLIGSLFTLTAFTTALLTNYQIADNYSIAFSGRGAEGTFQGLTGTIVFDAANLNAAKMDVSVQTKTISTGNATQDKHARGESWFNVGKYPTIEFTSNTFAKKGDGYAVSGDLTMHGITKTITIPFTFQNNIFEGKVTINREDYGIKGPFFAFTVSDEFEVSLRVPVK